MNIRKDGGIIMIQNFFIKNMFLGGIFLCMVSIASWSIENEHGNAYKFKEFICPIDASAEELVSRFGNRVSGTYVIYKWRRKTLCIFIF
jgi:hypothetical protein